jgi:dTDP-4-amino-4,6-dideoxygalactose transaminase
MAHQVIEHARIPFVDLQAEHAELAGELLAAFERVAEDGRYVLGPELDAFEREWAGTCGVDHCVGVGSGTAALCLVLEALGIGPGDEVITPANTYVATAMAISAAGATPVFVDCDPNRWTLDVAAAERALTPRTRAVIAVHLYGLPAALDELDRLCRRAGVDLIEDACQAHGARYHGRPAGSFGTAAAFSFYPSKNLGALGDGGAVTTANAALATRVRQLRNLGQTEKSVHEIVGHSDRLDALQAAFLRCKLPHLERWNERRREIAARYADLLDDLPLELPPDVGDCDHAWHVYTVRCEQRDEVRSHLSSMGVVTGIHYPVPAYRQAAYSRWHEGSFPATERHCERILSLPMYPQLEDDEVEAVATRLGEALRATADV